MHVAGSASEPNPAPCVLQSCRLFEVRLSRSLVDCIRLGNNLVVFLRPEGVPIGVLGLVSLTNIVFLRPEGVPIGVLGLASLIN